MKLEHCSSLQKRLKKKKKKKQIFIFLLQGAHKEKVILGILGYKQVPF